MICRLVTPVTASAVGRCCCKSLERSDIVIICASANSANILILLDLGFERAWKIHDFQSAEDFCNSICTFSPCLDPPDDVGNCRYSRHHTELHRKRPTPPCILHSMGNFHWTSCARQACMVAGAGDEDWRQIKD